jgi:hypothetical protein
MIRDLKKLKGMFSFIFCGLIIIKFLVAPFHFHQHSHDHASHNDHSHAEENHISNNSVPEVEIDGFNCLTCLTISLLGHFLKTFPYHYSAISQSTFKKSLYFSIDLTTHLALLTNLSSRGPPFFLNF